ncbi:VRR-NUC domain-containing protein [Rosenbergiella epipactidis]|uniref:VRR-NUC domain-containing protein n=1 Tax=Rosenbergiella epipactidis TaxID=1544694 RepID=UPI001F4E70C5|nr:VRR-NUC domain-containing protein [Rosenbergiella epipactidis]
MVLRFSEDWYQGYISRKSVPSKAKSATKKRSTPKKKSDVSPHAIALAKLAKNPNLAKGKGEHYSQVRYFDFFERKHPEVYELIHATPNGGYRTDKAGAEMREEGQKKGYPDISLDSAQQGYHGLRIEMKHGKNTLTVEQKIWRERLEKQGYKYVECRSTEEAISVTLDYMNLN